MKIIFLSFYSGQVYRGVETYVHCLSNELTKLGHKVIVYQNGKELIDAKYKTVSLGMKVDWSQKGNESQRVLNVFTNYWMQLIGKFTKKVLSQIENDVDVVIPTNGNLQSFYTSIWCKKNRKIMILSGQSGPGWDDRFNIWCMPDTFVALTKYQENWAKRTNSFVKTTVIPNGADIEVFANEKEIYQFDIPKPIILSVGALVPIKRHHLEIEAVSKLEKGSLVVVGKGELQDELQKMGDELLPGRFKIVNVQHRDMPKIYKSADLFTFVTSPWESFGIVLVEAMAAGLPIVASDDAIRREIVGEAGLFVDPTDSDAYSDAIEKVLSTDWKNISRNQAKKFEWGKIAKEYQKLFK